MKKHHIYLIAFFILFFSLKIITKCNKENRGSSAIKKELKIHDESSKVEESTRTIYLREGWNPSQKIEIDLTPPTGYTKGMTCVSCSGSGTKIYPYDERESICAACNGRGFDFSKE